MFTWVWLTTIKFIFLYWLLNRIFVTFWLLLAETLLPGSTNGWFMCFKNPSWPAKYYDGQLSLNNEVLSGKTKTVFAWSNPNGGARSCQWLGFRSDSYKGKHFKFEAWINFVGSVPPYSYNFGLKVCGRFYVSFISKAVANSWYRISESIHCNGGDKNHIILIFDGVVNKGQMIKMYDISLKESGKIILKVILT